MSMIDYPLYFLVAVYLVCPILFVIFSYIYNGRMPTIKGFCEELWAVYLEVGVYVALLLSFGLSLKAIG